MSLLDGNYLEGEKCRGNGIKKEYKEKLSFNQIFNTVILSKNKLVKMW